MQIKDIIQQSKIDRLDAELIIAHVLKKPREFVLGHSETKIKRLKDCKIRQLIKQRARGVPLAYLAGHKEFYGLDFVVNKNTLVPRPETELIVELALEKIKRLKDYKIIVIDVGTGTGCIPIAIAKTMAQWSNGSMVYYATDISKPALLVAKQNAKLHKVKINFLHGDLLQPFDHSTIKPFNHLIITANLPYLTPSQFKNEKSIQSEPRLALVAGKDGLKYYRQLLKQISRALFLIPYSLFLFLEIDPSQSKSISILIKHHLPQAKITIHKDLAGRNRVISTEL